jgi:hypothetical protein
LFTSIQFTLLESPTVFAKGPEVTFVKNWE